MQKFFDSIIYGFLIGDGVFTLGLLLWFWRRRSFTGGIFFFAFLFAWLVIFYGSFIEPRFIWVREQEIILSEKPTEELRVVLVSDFHAGPYKGKEFMERAVRKISSLAPEAVFIAGDFVYDDISQISLLAPLKDLRAPLGVFSILGNHDYGEVGPEGLLVTGDERRAKKIREALEGFGETVLVNQMQKITKGDKTLTLIGVDELWTGRASLPPDARAGVFPPEGPRVLLTHNPDIVRDAAKSGIDLVLAGHTHGGQIRLPFWGAVPEIPDTLGKKYDRGFFQFGEKTLLYITSGIGEMGPRARLFTPPEIVVLVIRW